MNFIKAPYNCNGSWNKRKPIEMSSMHQKTAMEVDIKQHGYEFK